MRNPLRPSDPGLGRAHNATAGFGAEPAPGRAATPSEMNVPRGPRTITQSTGVPREPAPASGYLRRRNVYRVTPWIAIVTPAISSPTPTGAPKAGQTTLGSRFSIGRFFSKQ